MAASYTYIFIGKNQSKYVKVSAYHINTTSFHVAMDLSEHKHKRRQNMSNFR